MFTAKNIEEFLDNSSKRLDNFFKEMDEVFEAIKEENSEFVRTIGVFPKINVINYSNEIKIVAAVAGYSREDISIKVKENLIVISSKGGISPTEGFLIREIKKSQFFRSIYLPAKYKYDTKAITAKVENGLLTIVIPKLQEKKEEKSTEIKID